ncbi:MAG: hypothetical protein CMP48_11260 [Rickettsiales bacterium]|nr:hypothetical protein [Rickettsiales bacterium]
MINLKRALFATLTCLLSFQINAQFTRLTDLSPNDSDSANIGGYVVLNDTVIFSAFHKDYGKELWKTALDGSDAILLKDITTGANSTSFQYLTLLDDKIVFGATDNIWVTNGTTAGTFKIHDSRVQVGFTELNGYLYFDGDGNDFWRTDGTDNGTDTVFNFDNGWHSAYTPFKFGSQLLLTGYTDEFGMEPYVSQGTTETTILLKNFSPTVPQSNSSKAVGIQEFNFGLFFHVRYVDIDGFRPKETYFTNGTEEGTVKIFDFQVDPSRAAVLNNYTYFFYDGQIYRSNGTQEGTSTVVTLLYPLSSFPATAVEDQIYFSLKNPETGIELWVTDGTESGTKMVVDLIEGESSSNPKLPLVIDNMLFFVAGDSTSGENIWYTDGSATNTVQYSTQFQSIKSLKLIDNKLLFIATDDTGEELWLGDYSNLDLTRPEVTIHNFTGEFASDSIISITITSNEGLSGLELEDFKIANGIVDNLQGEGRSFSIDIIPAYDSLVYLELPANTATDEPGNGNQKASIQFKFDAKDPAATLVCTQGDSTRLPLLNFELTFDEQVDDLDSTKLVFDNGSLKSFTQNGNKYTFEVDQLIDTVMSRY